MKGPTPRAQTRLPLAIRFKKNADGTSALSCTRADGSATWQRQQSASANFFPKHDLTHFAVETVLGVPDGFYGLISRGWNMEDFGTPWLRGALPERAAIVELIVGMLDLERASATTYPAVEYREKVREWCSARGIAGEITLDDEKLDAIRKLRGELFARLDATSPGDSLQLGFLPPEGS